MIAEPLPFASWHDAPGKRAGYVVDGKEEKVCEGAVQLAVALWLLDQPGSIGTVEVFPDGEHGKRYDIRRCLEERGFILTERLGSTSYGGVYRRGNRMLTVNPKSSHGRGDIVAPFEGTTVRVECKGGTINSLHSGVKSRLRSGLAELIGQAMAMDDNGDRQMVALPATPYVRVLAERLAPRCAKAGIEIALVDREGSLELISA